MDLNLFQDNKKELSVYRTSGLKAVAKEKVARHIVRCLCKLCCSGEDGTLNGVLVFHEQLCGRGDMQIVLPANRFQTTLTLAVVVSVVFVEASAVAVENVLSKVASAHVHVDRFAANGLVNFTLFSRLRLFLTAPFLSLVGFCQSHGTIFCGPT